MAKTHTYKHTKEDSRENRKRNVGIVLLLVSFFMVVGGWIAVCFMQNPPFSFNNTQELREDSSENTQELDFTPHSTDSREIKIPSTNGIQMVSGQIEQTVDFYNPASNHCYFKLSLYLSDGTLIYQSKLIAPDERITQIELLQKLQSGVYRNCQLKYQCYSVKDNTELSGADIKLEINVK